MALPPLRAIEAGHAQLSSTHLQGPEENDAAAVVAEFFPERQPLRHIGATSDHRLLQVEPGQALGLVNTEVTRTTPDTVSLSRATSTFYDPDAVTFEGPARLSAEQMTPRAATFLLPPLAELSHADYLRRAGGSEDRLSEEYWERAVEQLQNGYGVTDIAQILNVDSGQVTIVNTQLRETHLEGIAAAPSARSASPSVSDAGITTPGGTFVPAAELDRVRELQTQNPATRNNDGTPTPFGAAIGKRGTNVTDRTSGLNHVGRALGQEMIEHVRPQGEITTALAIGPRAAAALKREVQARGIAEADEQSPVPQA